MFPELPFSVQSVRVLFSARSNKNFRKTLWSFSSTSKLLLSIHHHSGPSYTIIIGTWIICIYGIYVYSKNYCQCSQKAGPVYKYVQYKWKNKSWIHSTSPKHVRESVTSSTLKRKETGTKITIIHVEIDLS